MNTPLRHVGQTARPEDSPTAAATGGAGTAEQPPSGDASQSLDQHPRTVDSTTGTAPAKPPGEAKKIENLKPGEPPPESSAGS